MASSAQGWRISSIWGALSSSPHTSISTSPSRYLSLSLTTASLQIQIVACEKVTSDFDIGVLFDLMHLDGERSAGLKDFKHQGALSLFTSAPTSTSSSHSSLSFTTSTLASNQACGMWKGCQWLGVWLWFSLCLWFPHTSISTDSTSSSWL